MYPSYGSILHMWMMFHLIIQIWLLEGIEMSYWKINILIPWCIFLFIMGYQMNGPCHLHLNILLINCKKRVMHWKSPLSTNTYSRAATLGAALSAWPALHSFGRAWRTTVPRQYDKTQIWRNREDADRRNPIIVISKRNEERC